MDKPIGSFHFTFMAFGFKFRDMFMPPKEIVTQAGVKPGFHLLDFGCGSGSYSIAAANVVGESGKVYALDIQPLAVKMVKYKAEKKGLKNIETILSHCRTGLPDESIDFVILFDIFHELNEPESVLQELHRVLKPDGKLSFSDHHLKEGVDQIESMGLFRFSEKKIGKMVTYTFVKK
jgi:ubiquinone/menaquinone biosynthesis C-methylase UbiE